VGFDPAVARPGHVGQRSMRERAANVGGDLTVDSGPGRGTRLRAAIPLPVAK
jgi:signal transduction histidine kinase